MKKLERRFPRLFSVSWLVFALSGICGGYAQPAATDAKWAINPNEQKVFIENKGQYDGKNKLPGSSVLYGVENLGLQIYFTKTGLTFRTDKTEITGKIDEERFAFGKGGNKDEYEREKREIEERRRKTKHISSVVHVTWLNANPEVRVLVQEEVPEYFNYMAEENAMEKSIYHARGYKKLTYQDLYPGIDAEYIFHPVEGIKYSLIIHPGADPTQIKMEYEGHDKLFLDEQGNMHITSLAGDIIDHAPQTFYASDNSSILSSFGIKKSVVSFQLAEYDHAQSIIIDPWTVAPAFAGGDNKVLDVQHDAAGNIYVYGSQNPYKVRKYTAAGAAVWTFNTANSDGAGDIATDPAGNTYCTKGGNASCFIIKLDPAGTLLFSNATAALEMWRLAFNYNYTTLLVAGAFMNGSTGNLAYVDFNTGALMNVQDIGGDLRALCANPNGNFHALIATVTSVAGISPALTQLWGTSTTYAASYNPGPNYTNSYPTWPVSGQNALAGFCGNLFLFNGATIYKFNAASGASVGLPTAVAGGALENNSGIATDACGNVYVGTQTSVIKYNPSLTQTGTAATAGAVYDIIINSNGDVIACGNNFVAALNIAGCAPLAVTASSTATCGGSNGAATATVTGGTPAYTYSWSPGGQTTQTATGLAPGTYTVVVMDLSNCTSAETTVTVVSTPPPVATFNYPATPYCQNAANPVPTFSGGGVAGTFSSSAGLVFVSTSTGEVNLSGSTPGIYTVTNTIPASGGCAAVSATATISINAVPNVTASAGSATICAGQSTTLTGNGATSYTWSANAGSATTSTVSVSPASGTTTYTVTGATSGCTSTNTVAVTVNPMPTVTASAASPTLCSGQSTTLTGNGATTYTWSANAGSVTTSTASVTPAAGITIYTVTGTTAGCSNTNTVSVTVTATPTVTVSAASPTICAGQSTTLTGNGATNYTWSANAGSATTSTVTVNPSTGTTVYTVTGTNSGCSNTNTVSVTVNALPDAAASTTGVVGCGGASANIDATSTTPGATFSWSGPGVASGGNTANATANLQGTYTVTVTDPATGCTNTATTSVTTSTAVPNATASTTGTLTCTNNSAVITGNSTTGGVNIQWTGPSAFSSTSLSNTVTVAGTYTFTVTDPGSGCTNVALTTVTTNTTQPTVGASTTGTLTCSSTTVTIGGSSSTSGVSYSWSGPGGFSSTAQTNTVSTAGVYTVTVTDPNNNCTNSTTTTVTTNGSLPDASASTTGTITCTSNTVTVDGSSTTGGVTYNWSGPGIVSGGSAATATVNAAGVYTVTVTDPGNGCSTTATTTVTTDQNAPSASAGTTGTITCANTSAALNGSSTTSGVSYSWNGPGGFTSTSATPTVGVSGTYTVTVTDPVNGCVNTATTSVITNTTPPDASASTTGTISCSGGSATVNGSSTTSGVTYSWSGPGIVSGGSTASATVNMAGNYTVTITDPANGCTNTAVTNVAASTGVPDASASTTGSITCTNNLVTLNGNSTTSGVTYSWSGPGGFSSTSQSPTANTAGSYTLTVTDPSNGCISTTVTVVNTNTTPPDAGATTTGTLTCANNSATVDGSSTTPGATFNWSGPGIVSGGATSSATVNASGTYTVTVTDPANGCTNTSVTTVTTDTAQPNASASSNGTIGCGGGSATVDATSTTSGATYSWSGPGGFTSTSATATVNTAGVYTVTVTDPNNGCTNTATATVNTSAGVPDASASSGSTVTCSNTSVVLNGNSTTSGVTYSWSGPGGFTSTSQNPTTNGAGVYTLTVTDPGNSCTNVVTVTIPTNTTAPNAGANTTGTLTCSNNTVTIGGTSTTTGATYAWSGPGGFTSSNQNEVVSTQGTYTVTVTDPANGCVNTATVSPQANIVVPNASAGTDVSIAFGSSTTLNASGGATYTWSPAADLSCVNCTNPVANPSVTTTFCVKVRDSGGCTDSACVTVTVDAQCGETFVPNAFSPNGDLNNDKLFVMGGCISQMQFYIYDRWGEKIFEASNAKEGWDGTYKGEKLNTAVFAYYLQATLTNGKVVTKKGNISLIR